MAMSDDVIRPAEGSPPSIFKQGSVQAFVKQATDIKLFDMKSNRGDWSTLHGLCGEAGQADEGLHGLAGGGFFALGVFGGSRELNDLLQI